MATTNEYEVVCYLQIYADPYVMLCYDYAECKPFLWVDSDIVDGAKLFLYVSVENIKKYINRKETIRALVLRSSKILLNGERVDISDAESIATSYVSNDINKFDLCLCSEIETVRYVLNNIQKTVSEKLLTINA